MAIDLNIIIPSFLAFLGVLTPLIYKYILLKRENKSLNEKITDNSLALKIELETFNSIRNAVERIFNKTQADRFLILTATNGKTDMRFASAIYEQNKSNPKVNLSIGAVSKYVQFEFDSHYRKMLKESVQYGRVQLDVEAMDECDLKQIYMDEEVSHSDIFFLCKKDIDDENIRLFYCSVATHSNRKFTKAENVQIKLEVSKIRNEVNKTQQIKL